MNEHTVVVLRFWRAMLDILFNFISKGGYCHCSSVLQVSHDHNIIKNDINIKFCTITGLCWKDFVEVLSFENC